MKNIRVVYIDNSTGQFCCESIIYNRKTVHIVTTKGEYIVIPYRNVFIIREQEVKDDGSVRSD